VALLPKLCLVESQLRDGPEGQSAQLEAHAPPSREEVSDRYVSRAVVENAPRFLAQWVNEDGSNFGCIEKRSVREYLVDVRPMGLAGVIGERVPALVVEFGKMCFVLRVDDVNSVTVRHDDIG
jgi:hypothetical protein